MAPEGWQQVQVGDTCTFQNGHGFTPEVWDTQGLPIIRIQNLNGSQNFNYFSGVPEDRWLVKSGDMLFAWAGTKGVSFGPTIWRGDIGVLNQHIFKVFCANGVDRNWLYLCLRHVTDLIEVRAHGFKATLVHVKKSDIERQPVLLPPLPEQQKIAEILGTWDKAIETTEALLANARTQKRALMQSLLTGTRRFPGFEDHPWREVRLGDVSTLVTKGTTPTSVGFEFTNHGVSFVKAENIDGSGTVAKSDVFVSQECHDALRRSQLEAGDILVTIAGAIGRVGLVPEEILPANTNQAVAIIRVPSDADISRSFVSYWLRGPFIQSILRDTAAGGAQPNVNLAQVSNLPMKCPIHSEQELIVSVIDDASLQVEKYVQQLDHLRTEKKSLMQQLLTGKRRVVV